MQKVSTVSYWPVFFSLSLVTIPEDFAKLNSAQSFARMVVIIFATLEAKRELEPKSISQFVMGSLLGTRRSAIGPLKPSQKSSGDVNSGHFFSVSKVVNDEQQI